MQNPLMHKNPIPSLYARYPVMDILSKKEGRIIIIIIIIIMKVSVESTEWL